MGFLGSLAEPRFRAVGRAGQGGWKRRGGQERRGDEIEATASGHTKRLL